MIHIAFTGLQGLEKDRAFRLFLADRLLQDGLDQGEVLKGLDLLPQGLDPWEWRQLAKYNPDEARDERGRWTSGGLDDTMMTVAASADTTETKGFIAPARTVSATVHGKNVEIMHSDNSVETRTGGSRSWRNNNPGNIEYGQFARNHGAIASDGRFAIFPDEETGMRAMDALLDTKGYKDLTVDGCIARRSPPNDNPTKRLQSEVRNASGLSGDAKISDLTPEQRRAYIKALRHSEGWIAGKTSNGS